MFNKTGKYFTHEKSIQKETRILKPEHSSWKQNTRQGKRNQDKD